MVAHFSTLILATNNNKLIITNNNNNKRKGMPIEKGNKKLNKTQTSHITLKNRFAVLNKDESKQEMDLKNGDPKQHQRRKNHSP